MKTRRFASLTLLAALTVAGCSTLSPSLSTPASSSETARKPTGSANGAPVPSTGGTTSADASISTGNKAAPQAAASTAPMAPPMDTAGAPGSAIDVGEMNPTRPAATANPATTLKAGSVDDNAKFADYLKYREDFDPANVTMRPRDLDVRDRHVLRVVDADGHGVSNATITVSVGETPITELRTYADGRALFHPKAYKGLSNETSFTLKAAKGELAVTGTHLGTDTVDWELKFATAAPAPAAKLDMAIVLDTTGSMGGEIQKFQDTINSISQRLRALPQQPAVRFGLVAYKDQREQYVTKVTPFTTDAAAFELALAQLSAGGGGDKPEDMEAALSDTLNTLSWDDGDAVRLSFIVTDAAPHTDYAQSTPYTDSAKLAAKKGIKLYGIGASSLETEGEYALRQLAQWTLGKYLFVTRGGDESTGGGGTASATVDKFREGRLDDIVVDIVKTELEQLGK